ncbi:MAG TPA: GH3 auxin-responsive promoter family protein [Bacteroidales bacterium]|nr:GH3 auxin-responsive promoter family protein [Bacteroidales bacterium]HRX95417.1 GH3 auxin-responsive promoter family protein [Bacteroidales bacterium]
MALINAVLSWLMKKRFHQIELFMKYPHEVQDEWFKKLISHGKTTEWGKQYDYKSIHNPETYRNRVPINDYNALKPYINRLRKGEQNILWDSEIKLFAKSSGTTSDKSKFIPVSQEALEECHFKGGKDMLSIYCYNYPDTLIFDGRGLAMGGSSNITEINNENYYDGDLSALIVDNLPYWAEFIRVPKKSVALMDKWELKIEEMARTTMNHNVTNILGVPSWTLLLLRRILEITGKNNIKEVWPNLEVFFHGGVNFKPYMSQFKEIIADANMNFMETYNASEGFFGLQDQRDSDELLLMLDYGIYYEFLPLDQLDSDNPKTLLLGEVKAGVNYAMVISTNAGLWRYLIGDVVMFTSLEPYRIRITGRTRTFINVVGEELIEDNAIKALSVACQKCNAEIAEFTAAPVYFETGENAAHEWLIEFERPPKSIEYFGETLDNALKSLNSDYEAKRYHNMVLRAPVIRNMPPKTFFNWLKGKNKLGGQYKVPRLSNDRKHVDEILEMVN